MNQNGYYFCTHWLLQRSAGWCAESGDGQVATGHELRSMYRQQHAEVWPRFDARSTRYPTLVGCTRTRHIQAMHDRLQLSARNGTDCRRCAGRARRRLIVVICVLLTVVNSSFPATG